MGDWATGNFSAVKLPWFANESASETDDSHDDDYFDDDEKGRHEPSNGKVNEGYEAPSTVMEAKKKQDLDMIKGSAFKQRANTSTVKLYADKTQEEERINLLANADDDPNSEQVKRADTALMEANNALKAARESLAKAEQALKETKAEFMKRKNDRARHLAKKAAKQKKEEEQNGTTHDDNPLGGLVMGIFTKSTSKFTVLVVRSKHGTASK